MAGGSTTPGAVAKGRRLMSFDPHQKAYVCIHVFEGSRPVRLVSRPEGNWCFLCGDLHDDTSSSYRVVGIAHLFRQDSGLNELENLAYDWEAERAEAGEPWLRTRCGSTE